MSSAGRSPEASAAGEVRMLRENFGKGRPPDRTERLDGVGIPGDWPERRFRVVLDAELDDLGDVLAHETRREVEAGIDACGHARGRQELAVLDPPLMQVLGVEAFEDVD